MTSPINQLPVDPQWVSRINELANVIAQDLGCMVMLVAIQEGGKLGLTMGGVPDEGDLHEMAQDVPNMLFTLAQTVALSDYYDSQETRN